MASHSINAPYIFLTGVIMIGIVLIFAVYQPMVGSILAARAELAGLQTTLQTKENFLRSIDQKKAELESQTQREKQLAVMLPADESFDDVVRLLQTAAQASGPVIHNVKNDTAQVQRDITARQARGEAVTIPAGANVGAVHVRLTGTYQQLRAFLTQIEHAPRLMDVTSIKITANPNAADTLSADLSIRFYVYRARQS